MAYLFERNGKIYIGWYDRHSGKRLKKKTKFPTTSSGWREAKNFKKKFEHHLDDEKFAMQFSLAMDPIPTLSTAMFEFYDARDIKPNTKIIYEVCLKYLIKICGDKKVNQYRERDYLKLLAHFNQVGLAINSINTYTRHIHIIFNFFQKKNYLKENIFRITKALEKPVLIIPAKSIEIILKYFREHNLQQYYIVKFLYLSGFRKSSAVSLTWDCINKQQNIINVPNIKRARIDIFPITKQLASLFKEMGNPQTKKQKIFGYKGTYSLSFWKRAMQKLGMNHTLHQLRKTFITKLVNSGISVYDASFLAGHKNIRTTLKYYTVADVQRMKDEIEKRVKF